MSDPDEFHLMEDAPSVKSAPIKKAKKPEVETDEEDWKRYVYFDENGNFLTSNKNVG